MQGYKTNREEVIESGRRYKIADGIIYRIFLLIVQEKTKNMAKICRYCGRNRLFDKLDRIFTTQQKS